MTGSGRQPTWRVLVDGDRVAVDPDGTVASVADGLDGFAMAPEQLLDLDGPHPLQVLARPPDHEATAPLDWLPLDEASGPPPVLAAVRDAVATYAGHAPLPPRRQPWFAAPWRAEADAWVDTALARQGRPRTGPSVPVKVWSLAAVLRIPTESGPVFLKASCDHFRAEPRITALLGRLVPGRVPGVLDHEPDRGWQLMEPLDGVSDEDEPTLRLAAPTAATIAGVQLDCVPHVALLRAAGSPERGLDSSLAAFGEVLAASPELRLLDAEQLAAARNTLPEVERRLAELAAYDVPTTLVHGDLHLGNVAEQDGRLTVFDWSDASVGHPFVDLVTLVRSSPPDERDELTAAYLAAWRDHLSGADLARVVELATVAEKVFQAVTYDRLQAAQEDAAVWLMQGVVARCLQQLTEAVAG